LGMVGARFLTNSPMLSVEGLTECKLNQTIQCEHFCCDRREFDEVSEFSDLRIPDKRSSDHSRANSAMTPVK